MLFAQVKNNSHTSFIQLSTISLQQHLLNKKIHIHLAIHHCFGSVSTRSRKAPASEGEMDRANNVVNIKNNRLNKK